MNIKTIDEYKGEVNSKITEFLRNYRAESSISDPLYLDVIDRLTVFATAGGKRLRAYFTYLAFKTSSNSDDSEILPIAVAVELLHMFLLIHDDVIDQDDTRYGTKNINGQYNELFGNPPTSKSKHLADSIAVLAGNVISTLSTKSVIFSSFNSETKIKMLEEIQRVILKVAEGEIMDVFISNNTNLSEVTEERILNIYKNKTASYTFELPFKLGLYAADPQLDVSSLLIEFSEALGIAFQLKDDLLGIYGNPAETGKTNSGDIREGKRTLLYVKAQQLLPLDAKKRFNEMYGSELISQDEIEELRNILDEYEIKKSVEVLCNEYSRKALELVPSIGFSGETVNVLEKLIEKLECRTI